MGWINDQRILIDHEEWCLGCCPKTWGEFYGDFQMDLQHQTCIEKYKARFMAHGFSQKEGIYYEENFALVARYTSIKSVLSLAAVMK